MNANLYEILRKKDLLKGNKVNYGRVAKVSTNEILDLSNEISELTINHKINSNKSNFVSSASESLSGGPYPCNGADCRMERVSQLAQYAALYGDQIFIKNYLTNYKALHNLPPSDLLLHDFINDLNALAFIEPLTKEGRIIVYSTPITSCPHCLAEKTFGQNGAARFERERIKLEKRYLDSMTASLYVDDNGYITEITGPKELIDHGKTTKISSALPIGEKSAIMQRIKKGEIVELTRSQMRQLDIEKWFAYRALSDIQFDLTLSQVYKTTFLTDSAVQVDILNALSGKSKIQKRNHIVEKHMSTIVPFIKDVSIEKLITLRKREEDSFILFRSALDKAINECNTSNDSFTEKNARDIYSEIIAPSLSRLDLKISSAKRDLVKTVRRKATSWIGVISFGIFTGLIPAELRTAAASLGLLKVGAEFLDKTMKKSDITESIRNDDMYFLWQVRNLQRK